MGLVAGLAYTEMMRMQPGLVMDLYIMRRDYDDIEHGIQREIEKRCYD